MVLNIPKLQTLDSREQGASDGTVYFGQISSGRLPIEVIDRLCETVGSVHVHGVFSSDADPTYQQAFKTRVEDGRVVFHGPYKPDDLEFLARYRCALLLFPETRLNIRYCLPNKLFQALSQRVPCLVSSNLVEVRRMFRAYPEVVRSDDLAGRHVIFADEVAQPVWDEVIRYLEQLRVRSREAYLQAISGRSVDDRVSEPVRVRSASGNPGRRT